MSNALNQAALPAPKLPLKTIEVRKGIVARGLTPLLSAA